jgi:hypothetical protein
LLSEEPPPLPLRVLAENRTGDLPTSVFSLNVPYLYNVQYIIYTIFITAVQYEVYIELKWEKFPIKEGLPNHKVV